MGARGPKRGWKKAAQEGAAAAAPSVKKRARSAPSGKVPAPQAPALAQTTEQVVLSAAHRENPEKLSGEALKKLGHQRGLALSQMAQMSDAKIREQLRYVAYRQYGR
jgi:hypothetical protein